MMNSVGRQSEMGSLSSEVDAPPVKQKSIWDLPVASDGEEEVTYREYMTESSLSQVEPPPVLPLPTSLVAAGIGLAFAVVARNRLRR